MQNEKLKAFAVAGVLMFAFGIMTQLGASTGSGAPAVELILYGSLGGSIACLVFMIGVAIHGLIKT